VHLLVSFFVMLHIVLPLIDFTLSFAAATITAPMESWSYGDTFNYIVCNVAAFPRMVSLTPSKAVDIFLSVTMFVTTQVVLGMAATMRLGATIISKLPRSRKVKAEEKENECLNRGCEEAVRSLEELAGCEANLSEFRSVCEYYMNYDATLITNLNDLNELTWKVQSSRLRLENDYLNHAEKVCVRVRDNIKNDVYGELAGHVQAARIEVCKLRLEAKKLIKETMDPQSDLMAKNHMLWQEEDQRSDWV